MKFMSQLSLRSLLLSILAVLFFPAFIFSALGVINVKAQERNLDQVRKQVNQINQSITDSVTSPFYMSPRIFDPCNPESLKLVDHPVNWKIEYLYYGSSKVTCEWIYYRNSEKIAIDRWSNYDRKLVDRTYFQNETQTLATDIFFVLDDSNQVKCVKQRQYENLNVTECYSEAGYLISIDSSRKKDELSSPLPPMLYWFAYR